MFTAVFAAGTVAISAPRVNETAMLGRIVREATVFEVQEMKVLAVTAGTTPTVVVVSQ